MLIKTMKKQCVGEVTITYCATEQNSTKSVAQEIAPKEQIGFEQGGINILKKNMMGSISLKMS